MSGRYKPNPESDAALASLRSELAMTAMANRPPTTIEVRNAIAVLTKAGVGPATQGALARFVDGYAEKMSRIGQI